MIRELPEQLQVRFLPSSSCRGGTAEVTAEAIRQAPGLEPGALGLQHVVLCSPQARATEDRLPGGWPCDPRADSVTNNTGETGC